MKRSSFLLCLLVFKESSGNGNRESMSFTTMSLLARNSLRIFSFALVLFFVFIFITIKTLLGIYNAKVYMISREGYKQMYVYKCLWAGACTDKRRECVKPYIQRESCQQMLRKAYRRSKIMAVLPYQNKDDVKGHLNKE